MELTNKEEIKKKNLDNILSKVNKIKSTVLNLKKVNIIFLFFNIETYRVTNLYFL